MPLDPRLEQVARELRAEITAIRKEVAAVKEKGAGGGKDDADDVPEFEQRKGKLTRRGRAAFKKWARGQEREAREQARAGKRERLEERQEKFEEARNKSSIDEHKAEGAARDAERAAADAAFDKKFQDAEGALGKEFNAEVAAAPPPAPPAPADAGDGRDQQEVQRKGEQGRDIQVPSQPGLIKIQAADESGIDQCFDVIGSVDDECQVAPRTSWWQPTFGFGTGTGSGGATDITGTGLDDGPPTVSIYKGLNLVPGSNSGGEHHPTTLWKDLYTDTNGPHTLKTGETNYFWVKITYTERSVLVADKIWHVSGREDYDIDFTGTGTGSGTGYFDVTGTGGITGTGVGTGTGGTNITGINITGTGVGTGTGESNITGIDITGTGVGTGTGEANITGVDITGIGVTGTGVGTGTGGANITGVDITGIGVTGTGVGTGTGGVTGTGSGTGTAGALSAGLDCESSSGTGTGTGTGDECNCCDEDITGSAHVTGIHVKNTGTGVIPFTSSNPIEVTGTGVGTGTGTGEAVVPFTSSNPIEVTGTGVGTGTGTGEAVMKWNADNYIGVTGTGTGTGKTVMEWNEDNYIGVTGTGTGTGYTVMKWNADNYIRVTGTGGITGTGSGDFTIDYLEFTGSGEGYTYKPETFEGSIKQYMLFTSTAPIVVPGEEEDGSDAPEDTKTEKYQLLGQITLDDDGKVTEWEWRLNHAFYWNAPDFVAGTLGKTKTSTPNYDAPKI